MKDSLLLLVSLVCCLLMLGRTSGEAQAEVSIEQLKSQAEAGDANAQEKLGMAYYNGTGVEQNHVLAFDWIMKAAQQNNIPAEIQLVIAYGRGDGVAQSDELAVQWGLKAAQQGSPEAESYMGDRYAAGKNVPKDSIQAFGWYYKAALQGDKDGAAHVATAYFTGNGVEKDIKKGFSYALVAASAGNYYSAYQIAYCYDKGIFVKPDPIQAYRWCLVAIKNGPADKAPALTAALMTKLQSQLATADIERAKVLADSNARWLNGDFQEGNLNLEFSANSPVTLPFEFDDNLIVIKATINNVVGSFLVDTGAPSALDERFAAKLGIKGNDYISVGGIGPNMGIGSISEPLALGFSGLTISNLNLMIMSVPFDSYLGRSIDGVLGSDVLQKLVVKIDFINKNITLSKKEDFQVPDGWDYASPIGMRRNLPYLVGNVWNDSVQSSAGLFGLDTGNSGTFDMTKTFQDDNPRLKIKASAPGAAIGIGGVRDDEEGIVTALLVGGWYLSNVPVDMENISNPASVGLSGGTIGNEIWRRFNMIIDYPDHVLFLQRNKEFSPLFGSRRLGLDLRASGQNYSTITVREVVPDSIGFSAGLKPGDIIDKVDDMDQKNLPLAKVRLTLKTPGQHPVIVNRGGTMITIELVCPPANVNGTSAQ